MGVFRVDTVMTTGTGPNVAEGVIAFTNLESNILYVIDANNFVVDNDNNPTLTGAPLFELNQPRIDLLEQLSIDNQIPTLILSFIQREEGGIQQTSVDAPPFPALFDGDCIFNASDKTIYLLNITAEQMPTFDYNNINNFNTLNEFLIPLPPGEARSINVSYKFTMSELVEIEEIDLTLPPEDRIIKTSGDYMNFLVWNTDPACCVLGNTQVITDKGIIKMRDIYSNNKVLDIYGNYINVNYNIIFEPSKEFVKFSKNSIGKNVPNEDTYIRIGHPIYYRGKEIEVEKLVNDKTITLVQLDKAEKVYSICSKKRTYVMMNNMPVCTWSEDDWNDQIKNNYYGKNIKWTKQ